MKIRQVHVARSDVKSAEVFFNALLEFYDIGGGDALDMFARDGQLTVSQYAYKVLNLDVWELGSEHTDKLLGFRPRDMKIGCSYQQLHHCARQYDMVVIDTPQGVHNDWMGREKVEHFDVIPHVGKILKDRALVVLYVNKRPYNKDEVGSHGYDEYAEYDFNKWMHRRHQFYQCDPRNLREDNAIWAYRRAFDKIGFDVKANLVIPCYSDVPELEPYAFRLGLELQRR